MTFFVDRNGVVVKKVIGANDWSSPALRSEIEALMQ
jgi:hypothetical protein